MLEIALHNPRQHKQFCRESGSLVLARATHEPALWTTVDRGLDCPDPRVEIIPQLDGVSLAVAGCEAECYGGQSRVPIGTCRLPVPASFTIGDTRFEVVAADCNAPHRRLQTLRHDERDSRGHRSSGAGPAPATLSRWFTALSSLNHWATSLQELYVQAAKCAVEAIGLDGGVVLRRRDGAWEIAASYLPRPELGIRCDVAALDELLTSPQTLFRGGCSTNLGDDAAIVVSPLRNAAGELAGAVYGYRSVRAENARRTIRYLEAHMVELLSGAVSAGIARIEREAEIDRRRVLLEQAVAASQNQLTREIGVEQRDVSLLFADLRNSTALSAVLAPNETYELLSQVMECLTAAVVDHDGLIIDYYGDGLAAMWNAPADQSDHAELACRAGLRMLQSLPDTSRDWGDTIQRDLQIGIGIHTGMAHVGNTGSRRRTKYGPRGTSVHLTSRIEAATKQLGLPLLATEATASRLSNRFALHRVCHARMLGFKRPIDLFSVCTGALDQRLSQAWHIYGEALKAFETGRLKEALGILATIDANIPEVPSRFLFEHVQQELSRQYRRRSTDETGEGSRGVIALGAK